MVATEDQKDPHVGDGGIKTMQEHNHMTAPILNRLLCVCEI